MTAKEGLQIQAEHISQWSTVLTREVCELLNRRAIIENAKAHASGYDVWRGSKIEQFVISISNCLKNGLKIEDIDCTNDFARKLC